MHGKEARHAGDWVVTRSAETVEEVRVEMVLLRYVGCCVQYLLYLVMLCMQIVSEELQKT